MTGNRPSMTVNRAWNPRNHFFQLGNKCKIISNFLRATATNWLCKSSGMSVLAVFIVNWKSPLGVVIIVILRWLKKNGAFQTCVHSFKWDSSQIQHWADIVFGRHSWLSYQKTGGAMRTTCGKKLGDNEREGKRAKLYQTEVNQRSS